MSLVWKNKKPDSRRFETHPKVSHACGVLLVNLGTPDGPDTASVRRYLAEFLADPEVIQLPKGLGWMNRPLGRLIARFRAPRSAEMYQKIWAECGSPLSSITEEQASRLRSVLPVGWQVFFAMRYGRPSIAEALKKIDQAGVSKLVVVPMYPQFSGSTTGTAMRELYRCLEAGDYHINVSTRTSWYDDGGYIHAQAKLMEEYARHHGLTPEDTYLVFSAHGLPVSYIKRGDPYLAHMSQTIELVLARLGWPAERARTAFQSRLGPVEWLKPNTADVLSELLEQGEKRVLICPISFTTDCLETLEEIDVRYRERFEEDGGDLYLCPALNTFSPFISALKSLVLRGPRPIVSGGAKIKPLLRPHSEPVPDDAWLASLVMVGVSLGNRVGDGMGPLLGHVDTRGLQAVKKSQSEIPQVLRRICEGGQVREAFVWNTCHRFEFYGWPGESDVEKETECIVARVREHLFSGRDLPNLTVNVLVGTEAWHHLIRTVAGLNSYLPGDRDIVDQLHTAYRVAQRAGTAGPLMDRLVSEAGALEATVRRETDWSRFDPGYCFAALSRITATISLDLADCRTVVIGGSTTSRSVLTSLIDKFEVPSRMLSLVYRGHSGGQIKALRKAVGNGRRIRVQSYGEQAVVEAIREADVVVFGVDRDEPVLDAQTLRRVRDCTQRPLVVIDFNSFGSTRGLEALEGVTLYNARQLDDCVASYADAMCASEAFARAVDAAELWIAQGRPDISVPQAQPFRCRELLTESQAESHGPGTGMAEQHWRTCQRCAQSCEVFDPSMAGS